MKWVIAPPMMLLIPSGMPCWIGVPYGLDTARASGPTR